MQEKTPEPLAPVRETAASTDFMNLHEIIAKARQKLDQNNWDYIVGGTETETTLRRNRLALDSIAFRPRVLRDVSRIDASCSLAGHTLRLPVIFAPVGGLERYDPGGAVTLVRAAAEFGVGTAYAATSPLGLETIGEAAPES